MGWGREMGVCVWGGGGVGVGCMQLDVHREVDLSAAGIGAQGGIALGRMLEQSISLTQLNVSQNGIGDKVLTGSTRGAHPGCSRGLQRGYTRGVLTGHPYCPADRNDVTTSLLLQPIHSRSEHGVPAPLRTALSWRGCGMCRRLA